MNDETEPCGPSANTSGSRMTVSLRTARHQWSFPDLKSDELSGSEQANNTLAIEARRSDLRNGLTRRQRMFILEKLVGRNDKDAALSAGYSSSVAENTKQRIWKPQVRLEFERLRLQIARRISDFNGDVRPETSKNSA
jgi:hypothetical protein